MSSRSERRSQCQEPRGILGRFTLWTMNRRHSGVTDWGLGHVAIGERDAILDAGCGGGRTVAKLAAQARAGSVTGVDISAASVAMARRVNADAIAAGRVSIEQASVDALPFAPNTFDLVTAVETHFWWPDLAAGMREVFRVTKPGGRALVIAEFYNGGKWAKYVDRLSRYTTMAMLDVEQHRAMLAQAGFVDVTIDEELRKGWISALGTKPAAH